MRQVGLIQGHQNTQVSASAESRDKGAAASGVVAGLTTQHTRITQRITFVAGCLCVLTAKISFLRLLLGLRLVKLPHRPHAPAFHNLQWDLMISYRAVVEIAYCAHHHADVT